MLKKRIFLSGFITIVVIILLIVAGPAGAVQLSITFNDPDKIYNQGDLISFEADIKIEEKDLHVPLTNITLKILGPTPKTCTIQLNGDNDCTGFNITLLSSPNNFGYGYSYGYENSNKFDFGYGYGYGYNTEEHLKFKIEFSSQDYLTGDYSALIQANTGKDNKPFFEKEEDFKIKEKTKEPTCIDLEKNNTKKKVRELRLFAPTDVPECISKGRVLINSVITPNFKKPFNQPITNLNAQVLVDTKNLPDLGKDEIYEVWLVDNESGYKLSIGLIDSNPSGNGKLTYQINSYLPIPGLITKAERTYDVVIITKEPFPDSDPNPSSNIILEGAIWAKDD